MVYTVLKASLLAGLLENEHTIYMSGLSSGTLSFRKARNHPNSSFYLTVLLFKHDSLFLTLLCHTQTISQIFCGDLCQCEVPTALENNGKSGETIPNHKVLKQNCSGEDYPELQISCKCRRTFSMLPIRSFPTFLGTIFRHLICAGVSCCYPE